MKKLVLLALFPILLMGCIAVPVYDGGYYDHDGPYRRSYSGPGVSVVVPVPGFYGGYGYYGGSGYYGGYGHHGGHGYYGYRR